MSKKSRDAEYMIMLAHRRSGAAKLMGLFLAELSVNEWAALAGLTRARADQILRDVPNSPHGVSRHYPQSVLSVFDSHLHEKMVTNIAEVIRSEPPNIFWSPEMRLHVLEFLSQDKSPDQILMHLAGVSSLAAAPAMGPQPASAA